MTATAATGSLRLSFGFDAEVFRAVDNEDAEVNESEDEEEDSEEESAESIAATLGLISTGGATTDQLIDDPVTSGSDSGQWGGAIDINPGE